MTKTELNNILDKHKKWLNGEADGERANLRGADLYGANLRGAGLYGADLYEANLRGADLYEANLRGADLYGADLYEANLRGADLYGAGLYGADLRGADLRGANLRGADLREANLRGADLYEANLRGASNIPDYVCPINCPQEGSFIGFKKSHVIIGTDGLYQNVIVKIRITDDAKRSSATARKCRCSKAEVISITSLDGNTEFKEAYSNHDNTFIYKTGEIVSVDDFDEDRWNECSTGIHFFITREEAVNY